MKKRLNKQARRILRELKQGPLTNSELAAIALQYNARIYDLRERGYDIRCVRHDKKTGESTYRLAGRKQKSSLARRVSIKAGPKLYRWLKYEAKTRQLSVRDLVKKIVLRKWRTETNGF